MPSIQSLPDSQLISVANQMKTVINADLAAYGATAGDITELSSLTGTFTVSVDAQTAAESAKRAATLTKDADRTPLEIKMANMRDTAKAAGATPAQMAATGLPSGGAPAPPTATVPVVMVDTSMRLAHKLSWIDAATPGNKKRPRGTIGAEIYVKIGGAAPTGPSECTYLALDTATPYIVVHEETDAGKMAHYMLRWLMRDGSYSPWSETVSATITG